MALIAAERAEERPDEIALRDDSVAMGWAAVDDALNRVANGLHAMDLGARRRVAVYAENYAETVLAHLGGLLAGASTVPINFHLTAEEAAFILNDSKSTVLFVGPENLERGVAAARGTGVHTVVAFRSDLGDAGDRPADGPTVMTWEAFLASASAAEPPRDVEPLPNLMYTSGTTGFPKGVDLPPQMFAGGVTIAEHIEALRKGGFTALGTHLVVGPMYHTGPLSGMRTLAGGTPVVVMGKFDAENVLRSIDTYKTASTVMVPTHFKRLLELPQEVKDRYDVSSMQLIAHTGAACPIDVKHDMIKWFGPVFRDAYGSTEVGTICGISSEEWLANPGSVGRVIPPFSRVIVVDDNDEEVPPGTEGRLFFEDSTGRGVVYPNDPEKTAQAHLRPGVFTIGEIGYVTPDGFVYITDRGSDMIVGGGVNIYPAEAEAVIVAHPKVADVAVIGIPHPDLGEAVHALVVPVDPDDPPEPAELIALCRQHLAGYKCPRTLEVVSTVGRNAMGKVNKRALRAPYWSGSRTIG